MMVNRNIEFKITLNESSVTGDSFLAAVNILTNILTGKKEIGYENWQERLEKIHKESLERKTNDNSNERSIQQSEQH